jgi:hypothetical protein
VVWVSAVRGVRQLAGIERDGSRFSLGHQPDLAPRQVDGLRVAARRNSDRGAVVGLRERLAERGNSTALARVDEQGTGHRLVHVTTEAASVYAIS